MRLNNAVKQILPPLILPLAKKPCQIYNHLVTRKRMYSRLLDLIENNPEIEELFPAKVVDRHYVYEATRQTPAHPDLFINQIRYYRMYKFFKQNYPEVFDNKVSVVDTGDTSGILFKAMKRKGLSVNINSEVVDFIRKSGIEAQIGDIECLSFGNKSFDYSFSFECIEHVLNPVRALKELSRITRKKVFLSIPFVENTVIYDADYWKRLKSMETRKGGWAESSVRDVDCHKIEFSTRDFKKILTHASLRYCDNFPINYFKPLGLMRKNEGSYFNFFILEPF